jgi:hypothetical protein
MAVTNLQNKNIEITYKTKSFKPIKSFEESAPLLRARFLDAPLAVFNIRKSKTIGNLQK